MYCKVRGLQKYPKQPIPAITLKYPAEEHSQCEQNQDCTELVVKPHVKIANFIRIISFSDCSCADIAVTFGRGDKCFI